MIRYLDVSRGRKTLKRGEGCVYDCRQGEKLECGVCKDSLPKEA